jgi:hypothetical protein
MQKFASVVCLKYLWGYAILQVANLTEEKSRVLNEAAGMTIIALIVC